ncbi:MAG: hypothetical protein HYV63_20175 [Candidatus Schekmanbacteria bacterium]|nr:hypothetical protein [Candidatus Schekmanbacteria bacterium]
MSPVYARQAAAVNGTARTQIARLRTGIGRSVDGRGDQREYDRGAVARAREGGGRQPAVRRNHDDLGLDLSRGAIREIPPRLAGFRRAES